MKTILGLKLYNKQETADLLGVIPQTVSLYEKQGRLKSTLIGGRKYYSEEHLKEFLLTPHK